MSRDILERAFAFEPSIEGGVEKYRQFTVCGMGGSALAPRAALFLDPTLPIAIHNTYGLPNVTDEKSLYIAVSYSGNTEEVVSFTEEALAQKLPLAVIASGGTLQSLAEKHALPYVLVPQGYQPRDALFFLLRALFAFVGNDTVFTEKLRQTSPDEEAASISGALSGRVPLIYTSIQNAFLGYLWKITLNETAKVPAFANVFPELAHNELQGLDPLEKTEEMTKNFHVLLLRDAEDHPRVVKQMNVFEEIARSRSILVTPLTLPEGRMEQLVYTWLLARATAHNLARTYGVSSEEVPLIEEFKKKLS